MGTTQPTQTVGNYKTTGYFRGISKKFLGGLTQATQTTQTTKLQGILLSNRTTQAANTVKTVQTTELQLIFAAYIFFLANSTTKGVQTTKLQLISVA